MERIKATQLLADGGLPRTFLLCKALSTVQHYRIGSDGPLMTIHDDGRLGVDYCRWYGYRRLQFNLGRGRNNHERISQESFGCSGSQDSPGIPV